MSESPFMSDQAKPTPGHNRSWPEVLAIAFSLLAIGISAWAVRDARQLHQDERASETIDALFEEWDNLSAALTEHWEVAHIGETPDTYYAVRDLLRRALAGLPRSDKVRILMEERGFANRMLAMFEHAHKQWELARLSGDQARLALLDVEMDFWTQVQLRNPRMLWFWSKDGGGLVTQADPPTIPFYNQRVLHDPEHPLTTEPDPVGVVSLDESGS